MAAVGKLANKPMDRKVCLYVTMACGDVKWRRDPYIYMGHKPLFRVVCWDAQQIGARKPQFFNEKMTIEPIWTCSY
jgi:hypothetical protein